MTKPARAQDRPAAEDQAARAYVSELLATHGQYAREAREARRVVDESMGAERLTDVLYKSRDEDVR